MNDRVRLVVRLLVVALVVSSTAAPFVFMATATPGNSGANMSVLPNANVHSSVPQHAQAKIPDKSAFNGNVMTSRSASSLEFTVTTEGATRGRAQRGSSDLALQFSDDLDHKGRRVAVSTSVLREALGYVPEVAYVEHSSGSTYTEPVRVEGGVATWALRAFSTNTVTFSGGVNVTGTYGPGSSVSYDISDLDAASDPNVTFTGVDSTERDTVSANGVSNGGTVALDVAGSSMATNAEVVFTGDGFTRSETLSGTGVGSGSAQSITVDGNLDPSGPSANGKPTLSVTGQQTTTAFGSGGSGDSGWIGDNGGTDIESEVELHGVGGTIQKIQFYSSYASRGGATWAYDVYLVEEGADGTRGEGTLVANDHTISTDNPTIEFDSAYTVTGGPKTVTIEFIPAEFIPADSMINLKYNSGGSGEIRATGGISSTLGGEARADIYATPAGVGATTNGANTASASFGDLSGGETVTKELALASDATTLDFSGAGGSISYTLEMTERSASDSPSIDVDGDGTADASHAGILNEGETATYSLPDLALSDDSATVNLASGTVDASVSYTEHSSTDSPSLELNGEWLNVTGTLSAGATASKTGNSSWLREGTNRLNISMPSLSADAPPRKVDVQLTHDAASKVETSYEAEAWSERYNISKTWASNRTNASLEVPFAGSVVSTRAAEYRVNGGAWQSPEWSSFNGTTLTVGVGDVTAGDAYDIRVNGSKVRVHNGSIQVLEPTQHGNTLDSKLKIESWSSSSYIAVGGTGSGTFVHYLANESYSASEYALVKASEAQELYLPNAQAGATARVRTIPLDPDPQTDVAIEVDDPSEPRFTIRPGDVSGDDVSLVWHDTVSGNTYGLYSATRDGYKIDSAEASSPVTLETDDDEEVLYIALVEESSSSGGGGGTGGGGIALESASSSPLGSPYLIIIVVVVAVVGVGWASRQSRVPTWAAAGGVVMAGVLALEALRPGTITGVVVEIGSSFSSGVAQVSPALVLTGGIVLVWGAYRLIKKYTRRQEVVLNLRGGK